MAHETSSQPPIRAPDDADDYYKVLGVPFDASEEKIRSRYHTVVRTLHPDRRRPGGGSSDVLDRFHQVQSSWRCLSDPTRRLLYDLRNFGRSSLADEAADKLGGTDVSAEAKLSRLQKEQAMRDVSNMKVTIDRILRRERAARGIVVRAALYGDLRLREHCLEECCSGQRTIEKSDLVGPVIDVALPLQCLVEQHTIVLPGGASASKADLPGFYNPLPLDADAELSLYVLYEFRGLLHEVLIGDRETLSLPFRKHAIQEGKAARGPFSPANIALLRHRRGVGSNAGTSAGSRGGRGSGSLSGSKASNSAQVLNQAVVLYRLHWLSAPRRGEVRPHEAALAALASGAACALIASWAVRGSLHRWIW